MYSVVLAAVLTTGGATPDWGWGCHGCCGGCHGCWGCCGGCHGCWGGCHGCWGGCHGCWGCCGGCWGCCGGCYGGACYGGGCYGSCYGCYGCDGCYGCGGGWSAGPVWQRPVVVERAADDDANGGANGKKDEKNGKGKKKSSKDEDDEQAALKPNQAELRVQAAADAALFVDGRRVPWSGASRRIVSPELRPGREYVYTLSAEAVRDGQRVTASKRVTVWAGASVRVDLRGLEAAKAEAAPARVTVRLPADAKLYVDGVRCPLKSATRSFDTPRLEPGQKYVYTLRAEVERDRKTVADTKRVRVEAGKRVAVDFGTLVEVSTAQR